MPRLVLSASILFAVAACDKGSTPSPIPSSPLTPATPVVRPTSLAHRPSAIDPPSVRGTSPNLFATNDAVFATWLEPTDDARTAHRLRLAKLVDHAWSGPVTIAEGTNIVANWADVPSVAAQPDGTLVAHWAEKAKSPVAHAYDVVLARSKDGGATWHRLGSPHRDGTAAEHGFVSLLPDRDAVLAIWLDGRAAADGGAGPTMLRAARVTDALGKEQVIDDRVCDCCSTSAALTAHGPVVVYRDRDDRELRDPWLVRRTEHGWSAPSPVHRDSWHIAGCPVNGPTVVANGREVVVAWYTYASERATVRVAFSSDDGGTFAAPIEVDGPSGARAPIGRVDLITDRPGEALVSWTASEREQGQLLLRRVSRDGRRGPELVITSIAASREAGFPKMEMLGSDLVIAWHDAAARNVRAVRLPRSDVPAFSSDAPTALSRVPTGLAIGNAAPEYGAKRLDGTAATLAAVRGHPVLLNVWATWCEPCRHELPVLAAVQKRHRERGLHVVALSVDREASRDTVAALARRLAPELDAWHDSEDRASRVLGISTMPTTMLFDAEGVLRWRREGAIADGDADLASAIERVLAK